MLQADVPTSLAEARNGLQAGRPGTPQAAEQAQAALTPVVEPQMVAGHSTFEGKRIHFIGIGGSGMCGLAHMLADSGAEITGSDRQPSAATEKLIGRGIKVRHTQDGQLPGDLDFVVHTAAVKPGNPDLDEADRRGIPRFVYAQMLGRVMAERTGIAVAGTHGKSTTSGMTAHALLAGGMDPSFVIGATCPQLAGSSRSGGGAAFVAEACEFNRSFLNLHPTVAVVTNIEIDHLDCYPDLNAIIDAFRSFSLRVPAGHGVIITNGDDENCITATAGMDVLLVGTSEHCHWRIEPDALHNGRHHAIVHMPGGKQISVMAGIPGRHNLFNAVMAVAACAAVGMDPQKAADLVGTFTGADRRLTVMGTCNGAIVIDDYGHHPTEIRATLRALREKYNPERLLCVFQPHQHSRTRQLMGDFAKAFADADEVVLATIYAARDSDEDKLAVTSANLAAVTPNSTYVPDLDEIEVLLRATLGEGDVVVTMGAGNIDQIARRLVM